MSHGIHLNFSFPKLPKFERTRNAINGVKYAASVISEMVVNVATADYAGFVKQEIENLKDKIATATKTVKDAANPEKILNELNKLSTFDIRKKGIQRKRESDFLTRKRQELETATNSLMNSIKQVDKSLTETNPLAYANLQQEAATVLTKYQDKPSIGKIQVDRLKDKLALLNTQTKAQQAKNRAAARPAAQSHTSQNKTPASKPQTSLANSKTQTASSTPATKPQASKQTAPAQNTQNKTANSSTQSNVAKAPQAKPQTTSTPATPAQPQVAPAAQNNNQATSSATPQVTVEPTRHFDHLVDFIPQPQVDEQQIGAQLYQLAQDAHQAQLLEQEQYFAQLEQFMRKREQVRTAWETAISDWDDSELEMMSRDELMQLMQQDVDNPAQFNEATMRTQIASVRKRAELEREQLYQAIIAEEERVQKAAERMAELEELRRLERENSQQHNVNADTLDLEELRKLRAEAEKQYRLIHEREQLEEERREVVRALYDSMEYAGFKLETPMLSADGSYVLLRGNRSQGERAQVMVRADGNMSLKFDNYEDDACKTDIAKVTELLEQVYGIKTETTGVFYEAPIRIKKGAKELPPDNSVNVQRHHNSRHR